MKLIITSALVAGALLAPAGAADAQVARHIEVGYHGVVQSSTLRHCAVEDASSGPLPCTWNIGGGQDGNGIGLAYWVNGTHQDPRFHYVWAITPIHNGWQWVDQHLGDALAEGGSPNADKRNWERCVVKFVIGPNDRVKCADGQRETA